MSFLDRISSWFNTISDWVLDNKEYTRYIILGLIAIGLLLIIIPTFIKSIKKVSNKITESNNKYLTHEGKRYVQDYVNCRLTRWMDETYKYSRVFKTKLGKYIKTSAGYCLFTILTGAFVMITCAFITHNILLSVALFAFVNTFSYITLFLIRLQKKSSVTNDLMNFLNLLGNYSTANTEIFSTFRQIAPQLNEPLASCLYESIAEAQDNDRSKKDALRNLGNKIEDEKFKEIIKNLEIAQDNAGSYAQIVEINRHSLIEYTHGKKLKSGIAKDNILSFIIILVAMFAILMIMGNILELNVLHLLFTTTTGIIVSVIAIAISLYFIVSAISASK